MRKILFYILSFFLASALFIGACSESFLDKQPTGVLSEGLLANPAGLESMLVAAYAELDGQSGGNGWSRTTTNWIYGDVCADDAFKGSDSGDQSPILDLERYVHTSTHPFLSEKWNACYDGVARTNDVLKVLVAAREAGTIEEALATQMESEARFLRAFYHFEAIRIFENVPYVDETVTDYLVPNSGAPYDRVEADMAFAISNLPVDPRGGLTGRITKLAATAFLGKVKLYQKKYSEALADFNTVISSGKYALAPTFHENFTTAGDNNIEAIFEVQSSVNDGTVGENGLWGDVLNFPYNGGPAACCGFHQPTQNLVNAFQVDGSGLPLFDTFNDVDINNDQGVAADDPFTPYPGPLDPRLDWTVGRRTIPYLDWGPHPGVSWIRDQNFGGPYAPKKRAYLKAEEGSNSTASGWAVGANAMNYDLMRYADLLLMAAECEIETGSMEKAREYVNMIRARANKPDSWVKNDDGSNAANYQIGLYNSPWSDKADALEAVQWERRLELALEGHRFFDLVRWGIAEPVLNKFLEKASKQRGYLVGSTFTSKYERFAIPLNAIDRSEGTLNQNEGF